MNNTQNLNSQAVDFMKGCEGYLDKLIDYEAINYPSARDLANHPETMDKFMTYYRVKDMCFTFLIQNDAREIGHTLFELTPNQIAKFFITYDPVALVDFFNQPFIVNDFIKANELNESQVFENDAQYQNAFATMVKPL